MKKYLIGSICVVLSATSAFAHHPLGGMPMETFAHGLLSGVGHPLLGFDHLFFVIIVGVAALYTGREKLAPAVYVAAMAAGCLLMASGLGLPMKEAVIGLSLLVVGGVVLSGRALGPVPAMALFSAFGLFHGSAFGEAMATAEGAAGASVLTGYLIGLGILQYAIAIASGWVAGTLWNATEADAVQARLTGAAVAGVGLYLSMETLEGLAFGAIGWPV